MIKLLLLICSLSFEGVKADADYHKYPERMELMADGSEILVQGAGVSQDKTPDLGNLLSFAGHTTRFAKYKNGVLIFDAIYTIDKDLFRISRASHMPWKKKHFLIFDGSVAFGEGLNDDETIHHWINKKSKIYEAYEVGFLGEGPQHHWIRLKENKLPKQVPQRKGSALIITHENDIAKLTGLIPHLNYAFNYPHLVETKAGEFKNAGTFSEHGTFIQRMLIKYCVPINSCNSWMSTYGHGLIPDEDIAMGARVIEATVKMYREQFDVENVTILWIGSNEALTVFKKNTKLKIIQLNYETQNSGHPSKAGALQIANALFDKKIVE